MTTTITDKSSDESCVRAATQGSIAAFEALVSRYESKLLTFLAMKTGQRQDAEDLLQTTFMKAYLKLDTFDLNKRFSTWIYTIAYHELVSAIRKRRFETTPIEIESIAASTSQPSIWNDLKSLLNHKDYLLLWLHYGEGYSMKETGEIIGKREAAVKTAIHRLRKKIRALLAEDGCVQNKAENDDEKTFLKYGRFHTVE